MKSNETCSSENLLQGLKNGLVHILEGRFCPMFKSNKFPVAQVNFKHVTLPPASPNSRIPSFNLAALYLEIKTQLVDESQKAVGNDKRAIP